MPLAGQISITLFAGDEPAGYRGLADWYVGRIDPWDGPIPPDAVNTYHWWVQERDTGNEVEGELMHRYGDGAVALVARVLEAAVVELARYE